MTRLLIPDCDDAALPAGKPRCCSASGAHHSRPPRGRPSHGCHWWSAGPVLSVSSKSCSGGGTRKYAASRPFAAWVSYRLLVITGTLISPSGRSPAKLLRHLARTLSMRMLAL